MDGKADASEDSVALTELHLVEAGDRWIGIQSNACFDSLSVGRRYIKI